jgi:hypothetical protein
MSSIFKTLLVISTGAGIAASAAITKKYSKDLNHTPTTFSQTISPIIIFENGTVRFIERIPPATVASKIRAAAKSQDIEALNAQLIKHNFYAIPEHIASTQN